VNPRFAVLAAFLMGAVAYQKGPPAAPSKAKTSPPAQSTRSTSESSGASQPAAEDWPLSTIYEFLAARAGGRNEAQSNASLLQAGLSIEFLLATVPDPQNSHYPFMFDRFVESIRLAAQDSDYTLDRFWLPWEPDGGPADTDWQKRNEHRTWQAKRQTHPGILLFRRQAEGNAESLLGVLLIGEDPVRGINKDQFGNALSLIAEFRRPGASKTLRVLGPAFSGSIPSLGIAMRNAADAELRYRVITGSATASGNGDKLRRSVGQRLVSYAPAIADDEEATHAFFAYLESLPHRVEPEKVAILAESGTDFSSQFVKYSVPPDALWLEYPMEISRLRNAYADDPELSALSASNANKAPPQGLQITLKDEQGTQDSIPSFSRDLTPVSQEAALLNTLATVSRERIEYVGIVASDVLDSIFLGRLLRQHCPDVRLFVVDSDLVYAHIDRNDSYEGMLMVSRYPLFTENQVWTQSWSVRRRREYLSAVSEGVYNAGRQLLEGADAALADNATPQADARGVLQRPALWLTVVGREGIWPVTTLAASSDPAGSSSLSSALTETSRGWKLLFWLMTVVCALFAAGAIACNLGGERAAKIARGRLSMLQVGADGQSTTVQLCLSAILGVLLIVYGFIAAVQMSFYGLDRHYLAARELYCVVIPALLLTAALACWRPERARAWEWIGTAAASLAVSARFCASLYHNPLSLFFVYRSVHIGNGVAPAIPAVLLSIALLWYAGVHLNRIRLYRTSSVELPTFPQDVYLSGIKDAGARLGEALESWWFGKWSWTVAPVILLGGWLVQPMRSVETFPFEWPYAAGLCLLYGGLWLVCVRFFYIWFHVRKILRMIEGHPLCAAFRRLPPELSPTTVWRWQGGRAHLVLAHSVERLRTLAKLGMPPPSLGNPAFETLLSDLENAREAIAADALGTPVPEKKLNAFANYLLENVLASFWRKGSAVEVESAKAATVGGSGVVQVSSPQEISQPAAAAAEEYVALRFVALIRYVTVHLKNLLEFAAGALILALVSLNSYPFQPLHSITTAISVCFFAGAAVFGGVLLQMHGNPIMSYRSDTKPVKLDTNLLHVVSFGALPLLTVLSSQFPSIGGFLFAWVKPALENLR